MCIGVMWGGQCIWRGPVAFEINVKLKPRMGAWTY